MDIYHYVSEDVSSVEPQTRSLFTHITVTWKLSMSALIYLQITCVSECFTA